MTRLKDTYGPGHTQADYLRRPPAAGHETGYWDERGIPAPRPGARPSGPSHPTPPPPLSTQENNPSEQSSKDQRLHHFRGLDRSVGPDSFDRRCHPLGVDARAAPSVAAAQQAAAPSRAHCLSR